MRSRTLISLLTVIFLVLLVAATLTTRVTKASPGILYVSTDGVCAGNLPCYTSVQEALDAADPFDEIRVATGTYTDPAGTVAEITETITLQGGWNTGFSTQDPSTYPTTLDAQGQGRVIQITGYISPTIDGFIITGGDASGEFSGPGQGGGIYSWLADPIIVDNIITNNVGSTSIDNPGFGGGIYLYNASASAVVSGNQIVSNIASTDYHGYGGGLCLWFSDATVSDNTVQSNQASISIPHQGVGGGLYLIQSAATVSGNTVSDNTATSGSGGGLLLTNSDATLDSNRVISNTAYTGGGLYMGGSASFTLTNNIIAQNQADSAGGGIRVYGSIASPAGGVLINNTFAQNNLGSDGEGVYATGTTTLTLTNNIVVSHSYGIYIGGDATATADYTLFFSNPSGDTVGSVTSTHEVSGDPLFVNPPAWDYHIQVASPAINNGTFSGAPATDFEGDPRPYDCFIDIGADENTTSDECKRIYLPLIMKNY